MTTLHNDPEWPRASAWLSGGEDVPGPRLTVLGLPSRRGSISPGRCDLAPASIRKALEKLSTFDLVNRQDLRSLAVFDMGDADISDQKIESAFVPSRDLVRQAVSQGPAVILGGDNAVTRPGVHGMGAPLDRCGLITLDAHLDLRSLEDGLTNGNPVRALLDDGLPGGNIVQIGIQAFANSQSYFAVAMQNGITVVSMEQVHDQGIVTVLESVCRPLLNRTDAVYFDLDLDVMDRVLGLGTPGSRPGGLSSHSLISTARWMGKQPQVKAMDLVELDPELDIHGATALTAAMCLLAFASGVAERE